jgi:biotin-(acetyl-CoA carboxylase) ligase
MYNSIIPQEFSERIKPYILSAELDLYEAYSVTSTNDWAWEHYEQCREHHVLRPSLFLAETQRNGRGTLNRKWQSPIHSGIYCSMLYPVQNELLTIGNVPSGFVQLYSSIAGLAAWVVLTSVYPSLNLSLRIRGVNDLYANHAKVGGILVETRMSTGGTLKGVVTGIGINLVQNADLKVMDERNCPISIEELLPFYEREKMLDRKQTAYLVGKCTVGLYNMFNEGLLLDYESVVDRIRGAII